MSTKKTSSRALSQKTEAIELIREVGALAPHVRIALRWCPGHKGLTGNETADRLPNAAAKAPLPPTHTDRPSFASFRAAIKGWAKKESLASYSQQDIKRLGHEPHPKQHLTALNQMRNKHSISSVTQLRTGHVPLFSYLARRNLRTDPKCACGLDQEHVEHFLLSCPIHEEPRQELRRELDDLDIPFDRRALHFPGALEPIANFTSSTWRLKSRWDWAEINNETTPKNRNPPS